ncbi:MAG: transposase, partial [Akkermansia sp.]
NMMENINRQIKRRTKVACLFPNTDSILRLVSSIRPCPIYLVR